MREVLPGLIIGLWALLIAAWDIWRRRVPNVLLLIVAGPALLIQFFGSRGLFDLDVAQSLVGASIGFGLPVVGYALGQVGAGDVKFATLLGFLVGGVAMLKILLCASLVLGLMSLLALIDAKRRHRAARKPPAAVAISMAFIVFLAGVFVNAN